MGAAEQTARESGTTARAITWADADAVADTLGRAFHDDPLICHLLPDAASRPVRIRKLFKLLFKLGLPYGACSATAGIEAVALWRPPGQWHIPLWQYLTNGPAFLDLFGVAGAGRVMGIMDYIEHRHPREPHWYLQAIGTDTAKQGKGYGGVVMRRELARADAAGMPCYLESSKDTNIPIYQSFGFEVTGEIQVPGGGPVIWPMWRGAR
ncbi:MAG: GNAT family N-acetyltransferase [Devosia sp.]|nr:GNAT family N-acetyltransferase [Devosia sp.]